MLLTENKMKLLHNIHKTKFQCKKLAIKTMNGICLLVCLC